MPVVSKDFLDIQATIGGGFTLKVVRDMIRIYSQMHRTDKYGQHSWIIWPVWLNGGVFVYKLSSFRVDSRCSHLNFNFLACFEQGVLWYSGIHRAWIHSETSKWHDKNIQSSASYRLVLATQLCHLPGLARWLSGRSRTKLFWVRFPLESLKIQILCLFRAGSSFMFRQL